MPSLVEIGPVVLKNLSMSFCYFVIISPGKRARPFNSTNLNSLYPRMLCANFGRNWPSGSGEFVNVFLLFRYYLPSKKSQALQFFKFEFPLPKDALYQVWLKFTQRFHWRKRFLNSINVTVFSLFHYYLPFSPSI